MEIKGDQIWHSPSPAELLAAAGQEINLKACVHNIRELGGIAFVVLRTGRYLIQSVYDKEVCPDNNLSQLSAGDCVRATGLLRAEPRAENGVELLLHGFTVLSRPASPLPLNLADKEPKITGIGAEGGAEVFELDYFGMPATLAQSPQMYKQTCVAFFDRVFEVGAVYRAELHNTSRHLNEYTGLDFEMGYIDGMEDVMQMETAMLQHTMAYVKEHCAPEIALLDVDVPRIGAIPCIRFTDALALLKTLGGGKNRNDLTPEDEVLLCEDYREKGLGEFVFVTHFPTAKRPFYVMDDPHNPRETLSFDLLFRGLEVTTGGQRIHDYDAQVAKMQARGLDPAQFESYIGVHRCGLPPHGGLGIGLERLTMKLCGLSNIRDASLFPRDINHLVP